MFRLRALRKAQDDPSQLPEQQPPIAVSSSQTMPPAPKLRVDPPTTQEPDPQTSTATTQPAFAVRSVQPISSTQSIPLVQPTSVAKRKAQSNVSQLPQQHSDVSSSQTTPSVPQSHAASSTTKKTTSSASSAVAEPAFAIRSAQATSSTQATPSVHPTPTTQGVFSLPAIKQPIKNGHDLHRFFSSPEGQEQLHKAFSIGDHHVHAARVTPIEHLRGEDNPPPLMRGVRIDFAHKTPQGDPRPNMNFQMSVGHDKQNRFQVYLDKIEMNEEEQGSHFAPISAIRMEQLAKNLTSHLPEEEKKNAGIGLLAGMDVGRYYWLTQGQSYDGNASRVKHLGSLVQTLRTLGSKEPKAKFWVEPPGQEPYKTTLRDLGYTKERLRSVYDNLKNFYQEAKDKNVSDEEKTEPWLLYDLLHEKDDPVIWSDGHPCGLMKFLFLQGGHWDAFKHLYPSTEKQKLAVKFADHNRERQAQNAKKKGVHWPT